MGGISYAVPQAEKWGDASPRPPPIDIPCNRAVLPPLRSRDLESVQTTGEKLQAFMMRHLRSILRITWMDKVTNKEILERTGLPSMEDLLIRKNHRWTGNLTRMSPDRLPKQVLYSQLSSGHRKRGHPCLRFKDTIKRSLKLRDIKIDSWTSLSQQRDKWRAN